MYYIIEEYSGNDGEKWFLIWEESRPFTRTGNFSPVVNQKNEALLFTEVEEAKEYILGHFPDAIVN